MATGEGGDFKTDSKDEYPWFSYQHDVAFEPAGSDTPAVARQRPSAQEEEPKSQYSRPGMEAR